VTVGEYNRFAQMTGRPKLETGAANLPATQLGWQDAVDYTDWLSSQTGQRYRLPSEAEWEHAHGAGSINHYWWGIGVPKGLAICFDCLETLGPNRPLPVGSFKPNPYGLYDTAGNVAEWTLDCYHKSYIGAPVDGSPYDNPDCSERVVRGGSFRTPSSALRITARSPFPLETAFEDIGFRVVRDLE
jgi:formylglycine-generating enzyme required for sulfatase activity